ncbi:MAG: succinate dehydrogenase, cytochrome b556 subunit [Burkholderiales bacterium]
MPTAALKPRYKYLNLLKIRLPLPAFVSILHRVTGAVLFLLLGFLLWLLQQSLQSFNTYSTLRGLVAQWPVKLFLLGLLWAYLHHLFAGIRHLFLDAHLGLELVRARQSSVAVLAAGAICTLIVAVLAW